MLLKVLLLYLFKNHSPCRACVCLSSPPFPFMCRLAFVGVGSVPAALIGGFVHLFDLYCISILCLDLSSSLAAFGFTSFPFVSLRRPSLAGLVAVFPRSAFVFLLSQLLWWCIGSWSSLFTTNLIQFGSPVF